MASDALVLDASVAVKWYLPDEEHADLAVGLLGQFLRGDVELAAPAYIRYELAAVLSSASLRTPPRISPEDGFQGLEAFSRLGIRLVGADDLIAEAYPLVHRYSVALYDALYLAVALRLSLPVITADTPFYRHVRATGLVVWLGAWTPG